MRVPLGQTLVEQLSSFCLDEIQPTSSRVGVLELLLESNLVGLEKFKSQLNVVREKLTTQTLISDTWGIKNIEQANSIEDKQRLFEQLLNQSTTPQQLQYLGSLLALWSQNLSDQSSLRACWKLLISKLVSLKEYTLVVEVQESCPNGALSVEVRFLCRLLIFVRTNNSSSVNSTAM
jgi:hypothetical protein